MPSEDADSPPKKNPFDAKSRWPLTLPLDDEAFPKVELFGKPLSFRLLGGPSLELSRGTKESTRIAGLPETSNRLLFLPGLGEKPLLLFPRPQLLCPGGLTLNVSLVISLGIQLSVSDAEESHLLSEWPTPNASRGSYGPVDSALLCSSQVCPVSTGERYLSELFEESFSFPELVVEYKGDLDILRFPCWALIPLKITNITAMPLEVNKVMIPSNHLSFFQNEETGQMITNALSMRLLSTNEAELAIDDSPTPAGKWRYITGRKIISADRRPYIFLHAYRSKTGLEHGF